MTKLIFIDHDGTEHAVAAADGERVLDTARNNGITGIVGDCSGELACATCHAYVDPAFLTKLNPAGEIERELLECALDPQENSRLTCQIVVAPELDGMILRLPAKQV